MLFQLTTEAANPLISGLQPHLAAITNPGTKTEIEGGLDFSSMVEHVQTTDLFQYTGSLTTPPCAEGLTFLVTKEPLAIDVNSFNEIKKIVKFNSRYTQNDLGAENLIEVGNVSGTEAQFAPPAGEEASENPTATVQAEAKQQVTKGATIVINEIQGTPTSMLGVIVKNKN